MANNKMNRVLELARKIRELIQSLGDEYKLNDAIDALAIVQATLISGVKQENKKSVMVGTLDAIRSLVK